MHNHHALWVEIISSYKISNVYIQLINKAFNMRSTILNVPEDGYSRNVSCHYTRYPCFINIKKIF